MRLRKSFVAGLWSETCRTKDLVNTKLTQTLQTPCAIVWHGIAFRYLRGVDPTEAASARESGLFAFGVADK